MARERRERGEKERGEREERREERELFVCESEDKEEEGGEAGYR